MIEKKNKKNIQEVREKAILVGLVTRIQNEEQTQEYLEELAFLALTAGADCVGTLTQKLDHPNPKTYVGAGKLEELKEEVDKKEADLIIFDDELSPSQLKNIERILEMKVMDRSTLILDIFAARATTAEAKTQVELAQYEYLLPRLTRMWTHLERQKGGIGMRGPGETQIETDRRIIRDKIALLKKKLEKIDKQMATQRSNRGAMVRVALIGYTNVGKSSLMTLLSKQEVFAENKLFATLDTTVRKVVIENLPFLMSDTVGFIRKLPHQLVESFKSTLDEVREADILVHVVDLANPAFENHYAVVNDTINEIGAGDKQHIVVFNKVDAFMHADDAVDTEERVYTLKELKKMWMAKLEATPCTFISVKEKLNINELKDLIYEEVKKIHQIRFPYNNFLY